MALAQDGDGRRRGLDVVLAQDRPGHRGEDGVGSEFDVGGDVVVVEVVDAVVEADGVAEVLGPVV
ncbi:MULTISPECIES: hypothetical protein, partial [Streptomyces]|uniref:hypothetical protein n=1 Tax=Streptomyces sp. XY58 TaxID=1519482 RepID=UPI001F23FA82